MNSALGQKSVCLTRSLNAVILQNLKSAREEAMGALKVKTEMSAFFKKYKDTIETYLTAQGYDVTKACQDFAVKQKASPADPAGKDIP